MSGVSHAQTARVWRAVGEAAGPGAIASVPLSAVMLRAVVCFSARRAEW
jgi:hypothetical protein